MKKKTFYFLLAIGAAIWGVHSCASVGAPVGGVSDFDPPVPQVYSPENYATNFQGDKITVTFDERIKYKELSKQLVVSPPIKDIVMRIKPTAVLPTRRMEIDLSGIELLPNTTYTFNFGNSVGDNHEGAAIPNFKYVFSTGPQIDSLTVGGVVEDAFEEAFDPNTVVMLYRVDTTFNDSTIYKERPMYFTRLAHERDSTFLIENIAPGTYQLVALVDEASNMTYDQGKDKIAFFPRYIELNEPDPRGYRLRLALGKRPYKVYQGTNPQKGLIQMAIDGLEPQDSVLRIFPPLPEGAKDYYLFYPERDTLQYWYTEEKVDSILFAIKHNDVFSDTINAKIRKPAEVKFTRTIATKSLELDGKVEIQTNKPVGALDPAYILLTDKDSIPRPFRLKIDSTSLRKIDMEFSIAPENQYNITILPQATQSILGEVPEDTAFVQLKTRSVDDYGNLAVNPVSFSQYPLLVQLLDAGKKVVKEVSLGKAGEKAVFRLVPPGEYRLRVIFDANGNGRWDTVDYMKKQQPERVMYLEDKITVRAMWDEELDW